MKFKFNINITELIEAFHSVPKQLDYWILKDFFKKAGFEVEQITGHLVVIDPITHKMYDVIIIEKYLELRDGMGKTLTKIKLEDDMRKVWTKIYKMIVDNFNVEYKNNDKES